MTSHRPRALRPLIAPTVGAAALALVALGVAPASAAETSTDDGVGDVWESTDDGWEPAATVVNSDLTGTRVRHLDGRVVTASSFDALRSEDAPFGLTYRMRFDDGPAVLVVVDTFRGWKGQTHLYNAHTYAEIACSKAGSAISYADDEVVTSVPRGCLGSPRWLELNTNLDTSYDDDTTTHYLHDTLGSDGHDQGPFSGRVRRG